MMATPKNVGHQDGRRYQRRDRRFARTYERPALRKAFAAFPADSKVAAASFAVMATVVSISDKLPPAEAASTAEAAAFSSGNMMTEGQVPPNEFTSYALKEFGNGFLSVFWLSQHALDSI
jgi:hypothetical protein